MRARTWIATALLALVALVVCNLEAADPPGLEWVPADVGGFVTVRVADILAAKAGKETFAALPEGVRGAFKEAETALGVSLADVRRCTLVARDAVAPFAGGPRLGPPPTFYAVLHLVRAADQKAILGSVALFAPAKAAEYRRKKYHTDPSGERAVYFHDDRTVVLGTVPGVEAAIEQSITPQANGALADALKQAGAPLVACGFAPPVEFRQVLGQVLPPSLAEARTVLLTASLQGAALELEVAGTFPKEAAAQAARVQLDETVLPMLKQALAARQDAPAPVAKFFKQLLEKAQAGQVGTTASLRTRPDISGDLVKALAIPDPAADAKRLRSQGNLKQLALAFHNFHDTRGRFLWAIFAPNVPVPQAKPLLSWRVALLPYIEEENLYKQIRLDEPWDSEHNKKFHAQMPRIFEMPGKKLPPGMTCYQTFVGPGAIFEKSSLGRKLTGITDGTSNTLLVVEAAKPVNWMQPADIDFAANPNGFPVAEKVGGHHPGGFNAAFADGAVRFLPLTLKPQTFQALITVAGGEVVNLP